MLKTTGKFSLMTVLTFCSMASGYAAQSLTVGDFTLPPPQITLDMGTLYYGQAGTRTVIIQNVSKNALVLDVVVGCGCTTGNLGNSSLRGGESTELRVSFDSTKRLTRDGLISEKVVLQDRASGKVCAIVELKSTVRGSFVMQPSEISWLIDPGEVAESRKVTILCELKGGGVLRFVGKQREGSVAKVTPTELVFKSDVDNQLKIVQVELPVVPNGDQMTGTIDFEADAPAGGKEGEVQSPIQIRLPYRVIPRDPLVVIPGAIVLSKYDIPNGIINRKLVVKQYVGHPIEMVEVHSSNTDVSVKSDKEPSTYTVEIKTSESPTVFTDITFTYRFGGALYTKTIPVIVTQ